MSNLLDAVAKDVANNPSILTSVEQLLVNVANLMRGASPDTVKDLADMIVEHRSALANLALANTPMIPGPIPVHPLVAAHVDVHGRELGEGNREPPLVPAGAVRDEHEQSRQPGPVSLSENAARTRQGNTGVAGRFDATAELHEREPGITGPRGGLAGDGHLEPGPDGRLHPDEGSAARPSVLGEKPLSADEQAALEKFRRDRDAGQRTV
jgi:hypothetical protein